MKAQASQTDINSPAMQQALKKFRRDHLWHRVFFVVLLFITISLLGSLSYVIYQVGAATVGLTLMITPEGGIEPVVPEDNNSSGGAGPSLPQIPPNLTFEETQPTELISETERVEEIIEIKDETGELGQPILFVLNIANSENDVPVGGTLFNISRQELFPVLTNSQPIFFGRTAVAKALLRFEVESDQIMTTVLEADVDGYWQWQVPEKLTNGLHGLYVSMFRPDGSQILAQASYKFIIAANPPAASTVFPSSLPSEVVYEQLEGLPRDILFDVRLVVPEDHRLIQPGEEIYVQISLINFSKTEGIKDVTLFYKIINQAGRVILNQSETVAVATQFSFIKQFKTSLSLEPGEYQIVVELPSEDVVAVSSDHFMVGDHPVVVLPGGASMDATVTVQTLIGMLLLFLFVLYFEFRRLDTLGGILRPITAEDLKNLGYLS